jgi:hypothetical protein
MEKIAIIGFGAASIGYVNELKEHENFELHIFERSKDIISSSLSGIRSDGKIFISKEMGGKLDLDLEIQRNIVNFYLEKSEVPEDKIEHGVSFQSKKEGYYRDFYMKGFQPVNSEFYHIGTDYLNNVMKNIYDDLSNRKNIIFHFNTKVVNVQEINNEVRVTYINKEKETINEFFDKTVVGVGRSGHKLVEEIKEIHPKLSLSSNSVDLGVRFELPNHIVDDLNKEMYEFKLKLETKTGYNVRTFCNNPSGFVTLERYNENEFVTVNGHSKVKQKTENTNFAILVTHTFTEPFNDPIGYGTHIAKLSNILAGGKKVTLQKYSDFKNERRTKQIGRVIPTLPENQFILGDLNLVFPSKTKESIIHFLETLNEIVPGITAPDNLLYGVEVKFYSNMLDNNYFKNIKFIGDCSGWSRSITYATGHGILEARKELS